MLHLILRLNNELFLMVLKSMGPLQELVYPLPIPQSSGKVSWSDWLSNNL